jgi:hypothetical protein
MSAFDAFRKNAFGARLAIFRSMSAFDAIVISRQICSVNCGAFTAMTDCIAALLH